jgi:hypothetical protein
MSIYTVMILACLQGAPTDCKTHERTIEASAVPTTAFKDAENYVARWTVEHPAWRVVRWRMVNGRPA